MGVKARPIVKGTMSEMCWETGAPTVWLYYCHSSLRSGPLFPLSSLIPGHTNKREHPTIMREKWRKFWEAMDTVCCHQWGILKQHHTAEYRPLVTGLHHWMQLRVLRRTSVGGWVAWKQTDKEILKVKGKRLTNTNLQLKFTITKTVHNVSNKRSICVSLCPQSTKRK